MLRDMQTLKPENTTVVFREEISHRQVPFFFFLYRILYEPSQQRIWLPYSLTSTRICCTSLWSIFLLFGLETKFQIGWLFKNENSNEWSYMLWIVGQMSMISAVACPQHKASGQHNIGHFFHVLQWLRTRKKISNQIIGWKLSEFTHFWKVKW